MGSTLVAYVFPFVGCILTVIMFAVPLPSVVHAEHVKSLGNLNAIPWVAAFVNCFGFTVYGVVLPNIFVFVANVIGLLLALYYTMSAITLLAHADNLDATRKAVIIKGGIVFGILFWATLGLVCAEVFQFEKDQHELFRSTIGWICAIFAVVYYASPMSTMLEVLATKNASSLHVPMIGMNFVNALLWTLYGYYGINRAPIWLPNFIGAILALLQFVVAGAYGGLETNSSLRSAAPSYRPVAEEAALSPESAFQNYRATGSHAHTHK